MTIVYNVGESLAIFNAADVEKLLRIFDSVSISHNCITLFSETRGSISVFHSFVMHKSGFFKFDEVVFTFTEDLNEIKLDIMVKQKDIDLSFTFEC